MGAREGFVAVSLLAVALAVLTASPPAAAADPVGWGLAVPIDTDPISADEVSVAVTPDGIAFAVWDQWDGTRPNIWSNRYVPGQGWGTPTTIESDPGWAEGEHIAVDPSGTAIAVWHQWDGVRYNIWGSRYVAGIGWPVPTLLETDNAGGGTFPRVAVDPSGNAIAIWSQSDGTRTNIWANRYIPGSGWLMPTLLETDNAGGAAFPWVATDPAGNAVAVWQQSDGTRENIWANRFVAGSGWGMASLIETDNAGLAAQPRVALDASGNAIAVWSQVSGVASIWSNRFVLGTGWAGPVLLETDNAGNAFFPRVAVGPAGDAVAVWHQSDGIRVNVWANRYGVGTGWGTAELLESDTTVALLADVAMDPAGNAMAVWQQFGVGRMNIWGNRLSTTRGWEGPHLLETDNAGDAQAPTVRMDGDGNAFAVWYQGGYQGDLARNRIWSNRYQADVFAPPLALDAPTASLTNAASVTVSGTTEAGAQVLVNGAPVTVSPSGAFSTSVSLSEGPNTIVAEATDAEGNTATVTKAITRDSTPPAVALASPSDGATTGLPTISVAGSTEPGARLVVNGLLVAVAADGSFAVVVALLDGANTITATATDLAGNAGSASVSGTYASPLPGLQQQLEDTQTELAQTRDALNQTNQELQDTRGSLDDANARLGFLGVELLVALIVVVAVLVAVQLLLYRRLRAARSPPPPSPPPP